MKCNNILLYGWKSKFSMRGKPKILLSCKDISLINPLVYEIWIISHEEVCNGNIESNIHIEYNGSCEGEALFEDAGIGISFKCSKCGYDFAGNGLPRYVDELNKFLTEMIKEWN